MKSNFDDALIISLMKMLNIKGPKTESCGIPHKTVWWLDFTLSN